jgi:hypothetical protein
MGWVIGGAVVAFLVLSPLFAADSRDGADWKPFELLAMGSRGRVRPCSESPAMRWLRRRQRRRAG